MAYTTADRDTLKAAMMRLATTGIPQDTKFSDGSGVTYTVATMPQMLNLLAVIERDIAAAPAVLGVQRVRAIRMAPGSGY